MNAWVDDDSRVYDDNLVYWAEYIADFDLEKRDRLLEKYDNYEIIRAAISKTKNT